MAQNKSHFEENPHWNLTPRQQGRHGEEYARRLIEKSDEASVAELLGPEPELTYAVAHADLTKYPTFQLEARLTHYEREYLFERNYGLRSGFKIEVEKTEAELRRRKMMEQAEALRVFEL